jgi:cytochrome c oxidase subunit IV
MSMSHLPEAQVKPTEAHATLPHKDYETHGAGHPGPREYITIAVILAVLTAIEVGVYYIDFLKPVQIPIFGVLAVTKFSLVAMFFMHLKFDNRFFSVVFVTGLLLACTVFLVILTVLRIFFAAP